MIAPYGADHSRLCAASALYIKVVIRSIMAARSLEQRERWVETWKNH